MSASSIGPSDEAVRDATGRSWAEWQAALDGAGGQGMSHRELVAWLEVGGVESGWWRQAVAVGYEKLTGRRVVGQTADGLFQVGVQRTLPLSGERAWALLTSPDGVRAWLGDGVDLAFQEGETYRTADGATGEVRVVRDGSHARLTRDSGVGDRPSTIQIRVEAKGDRAVVGMHEENLPGEKNREERRTHYRAALDRLEALAKSAT